MVNAVSLPHTLAKQIIQRAGGNPFFIEEIVRSLFDQGAIVRREGGFEVTEKASAIAIPPTITDVVMARIDRLEEPTRHLVKVASVIGRSFFYRILSDVATEVEDIPGKLSFLSEIQILQPQERMGEVEYLFKHALAQEAAYESLLPPRRIELHLKVAHSIEKIFSARLPEFYGMLAYHYGRAESLDKTEEYLIKAGEEALRSAASDEALHYYEEALQLYLKKSGPHADPEKVAMLEKNIALALYNRGQHQEAIKYFDKALDYYWGKLPKNAVLVGVKVLWAFVHFLIAIYAPVLKFRKSPTQRLIEVVELSYKKLKALGTIDPKRFFVDYLYILQEVTQFDLRKFELGLEVYMGASAIFSFTGISFGFSKRLLDSARKMITNKDIKLLILYDLLETIHNYFVGNWKALHEYDSDLINGNLNIGEIYMASQSAYWHGLAKLYQGYLDRAQSMIDQLGRIAQVYVNDFSLMLQYELNANLLLEYRRLYDALSKVDQSIDFAQKAGFGIFLFDMYSCKALVHLLMEDIGKAEGALHRANEMRKAHAVPIELCSLYRSQVEYDLYRLKESIDGNGSGSLEYRKKAIKSCKMLLRVSGKAAQHRTESCWLTGVYYWLINKQKKALKWWHRAIQEGERLGGRLELSRAYFEVGKRLLEPKSEYEMLDGIKAEEYLERARSLFEEMGLQWDLDELSRVTRG